MRTHFFTSESVSEGHPDKLADQVSDAILDAYLAVDPHSRVAVETLITRGLIVIAGEVRSLAKGIDHENVARGVCLEVGYDRDEVGLNGNTCEIITRIQEQSREIAIGVDRGGAGDQGMMFGFACSETSEAMPLPISLAHALMRRAARVRKTRPDLGLRPDAKAQVTVEYQSYQPLKVSDVVLSHQHDPDTAGEIAGILRREIIGPVFSEFGLDVEGPVFHINPTGAFTEGGPACDTGLTGRKIIVDTYGGMAPHGGGAFSGKDATKVDRSGAYMARHVAKSLVSSGIASRVQVGFAYVIGQAEPIMVAVDSFGTFDRDDELEVLIRESFDLTPQGIYDLLNLGAQPYAISARNGHFGNQVFSWERSSTISRRSIRMPAPLTID